MKKISSLSKLMLLAMCFLMWSNNVFSQSKIPVESITTDWNVFQEVKGVKFYSKKEIHTNEGPLAVDYVIIKLENTSDKEVTITYSLAVYSNLGCSGCNSLEYLQTMTIPAKSSIEGNPSKGRSPLAGLLINHNSKGGEIPQFIRTENLIIK